MWLWLRHHVRDIDCTGYRIVSLSHRPDIQGLKSVWAMVCATPGWRPHAAFVTGFALQLYWPQATLLFAHELLRHSYENISGQILKDILTLVQDRLSGMRVVDGTLRIGSSGLHPMKNPSERRLGTVRYLQLVEECGAWARVAHELQTYIESESCTCQKMLDIVRKGRLRTYPGTRNYANIRLIRTLMSISSGNLFLQFWFFYVSVIFPDGRHCTLCNLIPCCTTNDMPAHDVC